MKHPGLVRKVRDLELLEVVTLFIILTDKVNEVQGG